jgi:hypothetical protein
MHNDIKTKYDETIDKIEKLTEQIGYLTKQLACTEHRKSYLEVLLKEQEKSENQLINVSTEKIDDNKYVIYTKKELSEQIMFLFLPIVLLDMIVDYAHHSMYSLLSNYYQSVYIATYRISGRKTYKIVNNCVIEVDFDTCYVINLFTNELIDRYCLYESDSFHSTYERKCELLLDPEIFEVEQKKVYLLENEELRLIILISDNGNVCKIIPVDTFKEQEEQKMSIGLSRLSENEKIFFEMIKNDLSLRLSDKTIFDDNIANTESELIYSLCRESTVMENQKLTMGFYVVPKKYSDNKNEIHPFILEYDFEKKQILDCYKINNIYKSGMIGFKFTFDTKNNCVHILAESYSTNNRIYTYKKN